jgi:hypothetical protein
MKFLSLVNYIYGRKNIDHIVKGVAESLSFLNNDLDVELSDDEITKIAKIIKEDENISHQAYYYISSFFIAGMAVLVSGLGLVIQYFIKESPTIITLLIGIALIICFVLILLYVFITMTSSKKISKRQSRAMFMEIAMIIKNNGNKNMINKNEYEEKEKKRK